MFTEYKTTVVLSYWKNGPVNFLGLVNGEPTGLLVVSVEGNLRKHGMM